MMPVMMPPVLLLAGPALAGVRLAWHREWLDADLLHRRCKDRSQHADPGVVLLSNCQFSSADFSGVGSAPERLSCIAGRRPRALDYAS